MLTVSQKPAKFERLNDIIRILRETPQISVAELSRQIFTSKSTLRRDLIELENTNIIQRQYGMIQLLQGNNIEFTYEKRRNVNVRLKRIISHQIADKIPSNAAFFIDGSSTFFSLPELLHNQVGLHVITNNVNMGLQFNSLNNIETIIIGGKMAPRSASTLGSTTIEEIQSFHPDFALLSTGSIDAGGIYVADPEQAAVKEAMIANAKCVIFGIDSTKFDQSDYIRITNMNQINEVITDKRPSAAYRDLFANNQIKLTYPNGHHVHSDQ